MAPSLSYCCTGSPSSLFMWQRISGEGRDHLAPYPSSACYLHSMPSFPHQWNGDDNSALPHRQVGRIKWVTVYMALRTVPGPPMISMCIYHEDDANTWNQLACCPTVTPAVPDDWQDHKWSDEMHCFCSTSWHFTIFLTVPRLFSVSRYRQKLSCLRLSHAIKVCSLLSSSKFKQNHICLSS